MTRFLDSSRLCRLLARALLCAACILLPTTALAAQAEVFLRERIAVHEEIVTLGDLFENAGLMQSVAVFRSPDLGTQGVVRAARVARAAAAHGLVWRNHGGIREVVVRRPARNLSSDDILQLIRKAVAREMSVDDPDAMDMRVTGSIRPIEVDARRTAPLTVRRLHVRPETGAFDISFRFEDADPNGRTYHYRGRVLETSDAVVPVRAIARGEVMKASDLRTIKVAKTQLLAGRIADPHDLIGKAAKRRLSIGRQIRRTDVEAPRIVRRNDVVMIRYKIRGLTLQAQGRALEDGARGRTISVRNTRSRQTVQAEVEGPKIVTVVTAGGNTITTRTAARQRR